MLYNRIAKLNIKLANPYPDQGYRGSLNIENLRMSFNIVKNRSFASNVADISIYNLSPTTRNELVNIRDFVTFSAGYRENGGEQIIFTGDSLSVDHDFALPDIITKIKAGDAVGRIIDTYIPISFASNTQVREIVEFVADKIGVNVIYFVETENLVYPLGYKDVDSARNILTVVCNKLNLTWTVQDGNLIITKKNQGNNKEIKPVNAKNGMVGVPEKYMDKGYLQYASLPKNGEPPQGWRIKTLLRPDLVPTDRIRLKSDVLNIDVVCFINKITHTGDTYGDKFESIIEAIKE